MMGMDACRWMASAIYSPSGGRVACADILKLAVLPTDPVLERALRGEPPRVRRYHRRKG